MNLFQKISFQYFVSWKQPASMKDYFLKKNKNMEKNHPNSASRPTWHGHQRCQDNSPGSQVGIIGLVGDFQKTMKVVGSSTTAYTCPAKMKPQFQLGTSEENPTTGRIMTWTRQSASRFWLIKPKSPASTPLFKGLLEEPDQIPKGWRWGSGRCTWKYISRCQLFSRKSTG